MKLNQQVFGDIRDCIAIEAMKGIIGNLDAHIVNRMGQTIHESVAASAYQYADALIAESDKK